MMDFAHFSPAFQGRENLKCMKVKMVARAGSKPMLNLTECY
jgi:hypothetical protein